MGENIRDFILLVDALDLPIHKFSGPNFLTAFLHGYEKRPCCRPVSDIRLELLQTVTIELVSDV